MWVCHLRVVFQPREPVCLSCRGRSSFLVWCRKAKLTPLRFVSPDSRRGWRAPHFLLSSLAGLVGALLSSVAPKFCFLRSASQRGIFQQFSAQGPKSSCISHDSRHQAPALSQTATSCVSLEAVPWLRGKTWSRNGEICSQHSSPRPQRAHLHCWVRALLGLLARSSPSPCPPLAARLPESV